MISNLKKIIGIQGVVQDHVPEVQEQSEVQEQNSDIGVQEQDRDSGVVEDEEVIVKIIKKLYQLIQLKLC